MDFTNFATETSPDRLYPGSALADGLAWAGVDRPAAATVSPTAGQGLRAAAPFAAVEA